MFSNRKHVFGLFFYLKKLSSYRRIKGSVPQIDCMIEAKMKDESLFQLMRDLSEQVDVEIIDGASFYIK
ncbi:hypothetical protein BLX06_29885 [Bacillus cereus]|uniref:Uncharacterized protein n=1 Tax=Bacillus cereus TaxID=1396 RepID=A0A9X6GCP7_BACCE|nr:hypothetical protein BLX06_29885 [Bacillus cereus]